MRDPQPLSQPLQSAARIAKSGGLVLVFSDFDGLDAAAERSMAQIARRNTLILFTVTDPTAEELPENLNIVVSDGVMQARLDAGEDRIRRRLEEFSSGRLAQLFAFARKYAIPVVPLTSAEDTLAQMRLMLGGGAARR